MLQQIRDKTQGWFTTVIISVICVTFVFWGVHSFMGGGSDTPFTAAKVNGSVITQSQLTATYNRLKEQQQMQLGANFVLTEALSQKLHQTALEQLISSQALSAAALNDDLRFTFTQIADVIRGISAFQDNGHFSASRFVQAIASLGFTEQGFYDDVRAAMLINQMRVGIVGSNFSMPGEISTALHLINQKRDINYLIFPAKNFLNKTPVNAAAIQSYYQAHQNQYVTPESVELQYVSLDLNDTIAKMHLSDSEVKAFYDSNQSAYTLPAKWQLQTVFLAVNAPEDKHGIKTMKQVADALKHNQSLASMQAIDPSLQIQTSYWLNDKELDPAIQAVVSHLSEGQVSAPITTRQGLVVVKLISKQKASVQPYGQIKAQVATALAQQQAGQSFAEASDQLSKLTYSNPLSLAEAAKSLGLTIKTTGVLTKDSPKTGIWANSALRDAAFSSDVLAGNNSALLNISDTQVMVVRLVKHTPAAVLPLKTVSAAIKTTLQQQQAEQASKAQADALVALIRANPHPEAAMKTHHWQWVTAKAVGRYSSSINGSILNAAFQLARPSKVPSIKVFRLANGDYAVVQLFTITEAKDSALTSIQQRVMAEQIASGYAQLDYQLYVNSVMTKAHIDVTQPQPSAAS